MGPFPSQFRLISAGPIASPRALKPSYSLFFAWLPRHAPAWPPHPVPSACSFSHLQFPCSRTVAALHPTPYNNQLKPNANTQLSHPCPTMLRPIHHQLPFCTSQLVHEDLASSSRNQQRHGPSSRSLHLCTSTPTPDNRHRATCACCTLVCLSFT